MPTKLDARQIISRDLLTQIASSAGMELDDLIRSIDMDLIVPLRMSASSTPDRVVNIGAAVVTNSQTGRTKSIPTVGGQIPAFTSGTVTFPASNGGTITVSPGNNATLVCPNNQYVKVLIYLDATGALNVLQGDANAVEASANVLPAPDNTLPIGYVTIFNNAGIVDNILQSNIYQFGSGAGGGGGSGEFAPISDLNSLSFQAAFQDNFSEGPNSPLSGVDVSSGKTDPTTYNVTKKMYSLAYDATLSTDSGTTDTNIVLDAPPSFTVKEGDVVVWGTEARVITAVISQQNFTVDAFSSSPGVSDPVTISQALHTKDVYGTDFDGNSIADAFGAATFDTILMNYEDSIGAGNDIYDIDQPAHLGFSCSVDGTSWTDIETRPSSEMGTILKTALLSAGTSLYVRFFSVATSGSGIANLLRYKVFMQEE